MRTITLEEHFLTPAFLDGPAIDIKKLGEDTSSPLSKIPARLLDIGGNRIAEMDEAGIDMQVLSINAPGVEQMGVDEAVSFSKHLNDVLAEAIAKNPTRLGGFATIPTPEPDAAAKEMERCIKELGFKGVVINGHVQGHYLDDPFFEPILATADELQVPIYLHPTRPPKEVCDVYYSGFSPAVSRQFSMAGWGWHIETALHVIRMILGGVFDKFPELQIIVGHMGETLPFMLPRLNAALPMQFTNLKKPTGDYLKQNIHYTFAGFNYTPTFTNLLQEVGVERIMFSADYPYGDMKTAHNFLDGLAISDDDKHRIAHGNAEKLMGL